MLSQPLVTLFPNNFSQYIIARKSAGIKKNEESLLFLVNISFQHVLIGKTAGEMDSLWSAVIRTIYDEKWCVSGSNKLINSFEE